MRRSSVLCSIASVLSLATLLTGCGAVQTQPTSAGAPGNPIIPVAPAATSSSPIMGDVRGGQQPVVGAHIYLFAANPNGYGSSSLSLLDPTLPGVLSDPIGGYVLTDGDGSFDIDGNYTCTAGQLVYLLALGGNPGLPNNAVNPALALLSTLGKCPASPNTFADTVPFISINEVTTVASAFALSGFMTDSTHVATGPSANAQQGLANAFLNVGNLADVTSGNARLQSIDGNGDVPQSEINTLADMLVTCVNSDGTSACSTLFGNAPGLDGSLPADTVTAVLNIARNPGAATSALFGTGFADGPFQPTLTAAPNDWSIALTFSADNMIGPYFPAIDSLGNVWVPSYVNNTLTEFSPTGTILSGAGGFTGGGLNLPYAIAIDAKDRPWVTNFGPINAATVSHFNLDGTPATQSPLPCSAACFFPAFDVAQNLWISGTTRATVLAPDGSILKQYNTAAYDSGIAISSAGSAWTIGQPGSLTRLGLPSTLSQTSESVTAISGTDFTPVAIDSTGNVWYGSYKNSALGESDKNGLQLSPASGYSGGGIKGPAQLAIDGANRIWIANREGNSLSAFSNEGKALSPATGYQAATLSAPRGLAIDASGNVWITNFTNNTLTEFVGIATPVSTPLSASTHGQRP